MLPPEITNSINAYEELCSGILKIRKRMTKTSKLLESTLRISKSKLNSYSKDLISDQYRNPTSLNFDLLNQDIENILGRLEKISHAALSIEGSLSPWSKEEEIKKRKSTKIYRDLYKGDEPF